MAGLHYVSSDSETGGLTPEDSKIAKNRKWKTFCLVETTSPSPAFLQNSSQISTDTSFGGGVRAGVAVEEMGIPRWCLPERTLLMNLIPPVLQRSSKGLIRRNLRLCLPASITR